MLLAPRKEKVAQVVALRTRSLTVVLDQLEDSFNMAAVLRTCEGMGIQDVHVIENPEFPFIPHAKVTQGCDKWLDLHLYRDSATCMQQLKAKGFTCWVSAVGAGARSVYELAFDAPVALVFGNERTGVTAETLTAADGLFWIPMRGFTQSFNISVAVAASVTRAISWRMEHGRAAGDLSPVETEALTQRFFRLSVKQRRRIY